jgi:hypothetical protein
LTVKCEILSKKLETLINTLDCSNIGEHIYPAVDECDPVYATKCQKMWMQYKVILLLFGVSKGTKS